MSRGPMITTGKPCEHCGCTKWMHSFNLDPDAEEIVLRAVCVQCRRSPVLLPPEQSGKGRGNGEGPRSLPSDRGGRGS